MDANEILEALGGRPEVARELNVALRVVHGWTSPNRGIPAHAWPDVADLARRKGVESITIETLRRPLWKRRGRPVAEVRMAAG